MKKNFFLNHLLYFFVKSQLSFLDFRNLTFFSQQNISATLQGTENERKICKLTVCDADYVMEVDKNFEPEPKNKIKRGCRDSDSDLVQPEAKRKGPGGRPTELKPLCKFSPTAIKEKTDKGFELLVKEWSNVNSKTPIPFDKYVAKLAMRYYFNTGENLDKEKGEMFNKVVTLLEF